MRSFEVCLGEPATGMGRTRLNKMGHRSSHARLSTLGRTRIDYCEPEEHASTSPPDLPPRGLVPSTRPLQFLLPYLPQIPCAPPHSILLDDVGAQQIIRIQVREPSLPAVRRRDLDSVPCFFRVRSV